MRVVATVPMSYERYYSWSGDLGLRSGHGWIVPTGAAGAAAGLREPLAAIPPSGIRG